MKYFNFFNARLLFTILLGMGSILCIQNVFGQTTPPKNIIVLISDGWGYNHIKAVDYYNGEIQAYENFAVKYGMSTYPATTDDIPDIDVNDFNTGYNSKKAWTDPNYVNKGYTGSAPAATAMATGVKSAKYAIGVDIFGNPLKTIVEQAEELGKATGVVTSVQFSHATPASYVVHNQSRNNYSDIANAMLNSDIDVIMGCGNPDFDFDGQPVTGDKEYNYIGGEATWNALKNGTHAGNWTLVESKADFEALISNATPPAKVVGVPQVAQTLQQQRALTLGASGYLEGGLEDAFKVPFVENVPSLEQMTKAALNVLDENANGLFLMIEGGAVDWAGHANQPGRLIEEQHDFNKSVDAVIQWVENNSSWDETLVIVTGDHECGYLTGPAYGGGADLVKTYPVINNGKGNMPGMKFNSGGHTNQIIPLFAHGQGAQLFSQYADDEDMVRGKYINNSELGQVCFELWKTPETPELPEPKNIVVLISDGWGVNHIDATKYYTGKTPVFEDQSQAFDKMFMSTYMAKTKDANGVDFWNTEYVSSEAYTNYYYLEPGGDYNSTEKNAIKATGSAPAATAMASGIKSYYKGIGVDVNHNKLKNIVHVASEKGKASGVVTSVPWTHATPAAFAVSNTYRNNYHELARDMLLNTQLDVIMGGGHPMYDADGQLLVEPAYNYICQKGYEGLVSGATTFDVASTTGNTTVQDIDNDDTPDAWTLIENKNDFIALADGTTVPKRVVGFAPVAETLQEGRSGDNKTDAYAVALTPTIPSLSIMTQGALNVLAQNGGNNGFFLMVEGGAVDWSGHANEPGRIIEEQDDFNQAVEAVVNWVNTNSNWDETLVIVTGDHECGFLTGPDYDDGADLISTYPVKDNGVGNMPDMKFCSGGHTNQLIPFYAKGAGADLLRKYADEEDYLRGRYLNNTELGQAMFKLWRDHIGVMNSAPVVNKHIEDQKAIVNETFTFDVPHDLFVDPDGDPINMKIEVSGTQASATWVNINNRTISGTPERKDVIKVTVKASDKSNDNLQYGYTSATFNIRVSDGAYKLTVLHNNDGESDLLPETVSTGGFEGEYGSIAMFTAKVNELRNAAANAGNSVVMLSSGDNFLASPEFDASTSTTWYDAIGLSYIGYDAVCIGNHDFDFGPDVLADFIGGYTQSTPPYLSANLDFSNETKLKALKDAGRIQSHVVIEKDGEKIGIIGLTTPELPHISSPRNVEVNSELASVVQAEVTALTNAGVNKIILISHLQSVTEDAELVKDLSGVDIMIAGGGDELLTHNPDDGKPFDIDVYDQYPMELTDKDGKTVYLITAPGQYRYVGKLVVEFNQTGEITNVDVANSGPVLVTNVTPCPDVQSEVVDPVANHVADLKTNIIATSEVELDGLKPHLRTQETNEGNLVADALLWTATQHAADYGVKVPDVALQNGGGVRNNTLIPVGNITEYTTFDILPFPNYVCVIEDIPAAQFKEIMENAVSKVESVSGRFAQIAGFTMVYNPNGTAQELDDNGAVTTAGERVISITLSDGTEIVKDGELVTDAPAINIATIDFLARGGDQYPYRGASFTSLGLSYQQALYKYISEELSGQITANDYPEGGEERITTSSANTAPQLNNAIADQSGTVNEAFSFVVPATTFSDADDDDLTFSATLSDGSSLPAWLSFNAENKTFSGTPDAETTLSIKITVSDGQATVSDEFDLSVILSGIYGYQAVKDVAIYPNPTNGVLHIDFNGAVNAKVLVKNIIGKVLIEKQISEDKNVIYLNGFAGGIYFLQLQTADNVKVVRRIVIE